MKAVFVLLFVTVAALAVEVPDEFVEAAWDLRREVMANGGAKHPVTKRAMLKLDKCRALGQECSMWNGCCDPNSYCTNWVPFNGGVCATKTPGYLAEEANVVPL